MCLFFNTFKVERKTLSTFHLWQDHKQSLRYATGINKRTLIQVKRDKSILKLK